MACPGDIAAACTFNGKQEFTLHLPASGKRPSENVVELKAQTMAFMNSFLNSHNLNADEVDLMEEVICEGEGEDGESGKPAGNQQQQKGGKKRKQGQAA